MIVYSCSGKYDTRLPFLWVVLTVLLIGALLPCPVTAQPEAVHTDSIQASHSRKMITFHLGNLQQGNSDYTDYYQLACHFSLLQEPLEALGYLKLAIMKGAKGEDVLTDTDFDSLRADKQLWRDVDTLLKLQYAGKNPGISDLDLGYELWQMMVEDQRYRTLKKNYKLKKPIVFNTTQHKASLVRVKEIIQKSGWPKYSEVGKEGGDAVFFVFQHDSEKSMQHILPLFIAAATAGEADITKAAMMIDRYLCYTEQVQLYGTQAFRKIGAGQNRTDIPLQLYPIADEQNLISRRERIGLPDFGENCKRLGVVYTPITERPDYKTIPLKFKWINQGYLLGGKE